MPDIFNDYDENGYRVTCAGSRSSKIEDQAIVRNLRDRVEFKDKIADMSDQALVNEYDEFALSDLFGNNDERFLEWLGLGGS